MDLTTIVTLIGEIGVLIGVIVPVIISIKRIANGTKCQLRSEMLRIYYHNHQLSEIRQYEYENFVALYEAYKALGGNSFIDEIYEKIKDVFSQDKIIRIKGKLNLEEGRDPSIILDDATEFDQSTFDSSTEGVVVEKKKQSIYLINIVVK